MIIRKATYTDMGDIISAISLKNIDYITAEHVVEDIENARQFVMMDEDIFQLLLYLLFKITISITML